MFGLSRLGAQKSPGSPLSAHLVVNYEYILGDKSKFPKEMLLICEEETP